MLLAAALVTSGCAATRPHAPAAAPAADAGAARCTTDRAADATGARDTVDVALAVATTVLVAGAIAAGVVFGAHGGAITPPLQLDGASAACASHDRGTDCGGNAPLCQDGTDPASPG